jgi:hypothetical protein
VHHPPAVKSRIPFLGKRYRIHKEKSSRTNHQRRGGDDRGGRKTSVVEVIPSAPPLLDAGGEHYRRRPSVGAAEDRAASLARGLTRLIVALPASNEEDSIVTEVRAGGRSQSADTARPDRSVSPVTKGRRRKRHNRHDKDDNKEDNLNHNKSPLAQMKRLSKSATTLSKSFEKLNTGGEGEGKRKRRSKSRDKKAGDKNNKRRPEEAADQPKDGSKEVTIAKLGPFKMSLELRGDPGSRVKEVAAAAASGLHHKSKNTSEDRHDKEKSEKQQHRRRKSDGKGDRRDHQVATEKQLPAESKTDAIEIEKHESKSNGSQNEISKAGAAGAATAVKVKKTSKAERIIVSKLAKSDRPRRESAQQQQQQQPQQVVETGGLEDYRLTLNKRKQSGGGSSPLKYSRSISQPNPPPSSASEFVLSELIVTGSSELGRKPVANTTAVTTSSSGSSRLVTSKKKHATSLSHSDRVGAVNVKQLRRSSTAREPSSSFSLCRSDDSTLDASPGQVMFDNPAFDTSPDLSRRRHAAEGQQERDTSSWQELRHKLLDGGLVAATADDATAGEKRRKSLLQKSRPQSDYSLMERSSSSSSQSETEDSSEDNKRRSPPTQTQSLSEGSSEEVWRGGGRSTARAGRANNPNQHFDSDSDDLSDLGNACHQLGECYIHDINLVNDLSKVYKVLNKLPFLFVAISKNSNFVIKL